MQQILIPYKYSKLRARCLLRTIGHLSIGFEPQWFEGGSPAELRNKAAAQTNDEIIVFNDADTIVPHDQILQAILQARADKGLVYAYTLYFRTDSATNIIEELHSPPSFACVAISRSCFDKLGGFDESYETYEDVDFAMRAQDYWPVRRVDGIATHLWHGDRDADGVPDDVDPVKAANSKARWERRWVTSTV